MWIKMDPVVYDEWPDISKHSFSSQAKYGQSPGGETKPNPLHNYQ